ncbi:TPA: DeoR family transcriptional regulator, partial [Acinetobacter baumannii]
RLTKIIGERMTHHHLRDPQVIQEITASFRVGTMTVGDLASHFGVSKSTIRKILAEAGLAINRAHKTKEEHAMLQHLALHGITKFDQLKDRLLTATTAKAFFMDQSINTRVQWLHESVQEDKSHENHDPLQHSKFATGSITRN